MKKPSKKLSSQMKNSNLVFILPLVGISVAFIMLLLLPNYHELKKQRELLQLQKDFIAKTETLKGEISELQAAVTKTQQFCSNWDRQAPTEDQIAQIHKQINERVSEAGATVTGFDPQPHVAMKTLVRVPLTIKTAGTFPQMLSMLANLEQMPESVWLEDLRLRAGGKDTENMECEVTLVVFAKNSEDSN